MTIATHHRTPPMFSRQWEAARDEARDLDRYMLNWDGADADPVPLGLIRQTLRLFRHLEDSAIPAPDTIYQGADGTVFAEWHYPSGAVQVANVTTGGVHVVVMGPDGKIVPADTAPPETADSCSGKATDGDPFEFSLAA